MSLIDVQVADRIATATLQRAPVNAWNADLFDEFHRVLDRLAERSDWSVLHIRSALKVFSAGADLVEMKGHFANPDRAEAAGRISGPFHRLFQRISDLPQVSIAEINGAALGGGFELALACDLRIAAIEAKCGLPEATLGLLPAGGGTQRLTWLAGPAVAARIILAADNLDGQEAQRLGLVQWAVPRAELAETALTLARRVASLHPLAIAACKTCIRAATDAERNGFQVETDWTARLLATAETQVRVSDFLEGVRA